MISKGLLRLKDRLIVRMPDLELIDALLTFIRGIFEAIVLNPDSKATADIFLFVGVQLEIQCL